MNEFDVINTCFASLVASDDALGLKDDVALLNPPNGRQSIVTTDTLVEGVHFLADDPLASVAQKLLRVNISDVLAKGGVPWGVLLNLSWPQGRNIKHIETFAEGLKTDLSHWDISLLGGDTTSTSGPLTVSATMMGHCPASGPVLRSGAKLGDDIWVTGAIGDGFIGLKAAQGELDFLSSEQIALLSWRYRVPEIQGVEVADMVSENASASADVSDGLVADLGHIAKASGLKAIIQMAAIPMSDSVRASLADESISEAHLITGGDDYQVVFTAPASAKSAIMRANLQHGIVATRIGSMELGDGVVVRGENGESVALPETGWTHF